MTLIDQAAAESVRARVRTTAKTIINMPEAAGRFATAVKLVGLGVMPAQVRALLAHAPQDAEAPAASPCRVQSYVEKCAWAYGVSVDELKANPAAYAETSEELASNVFESDEESQYD